MMSFASNPAFSAPEFSIIDKTKTPSGNHKMYLVSGSGNTIAKNGFVKKQLLLMQKQKLHLMWHQLQ